MPRFVRLFFLLACCAAPVPILAQTTMSASECPVLDVSDPEARNSLHSTKLANAP